MYPEIDAHTFVEWDQTIATNNPVPPGSFALYPNYLKQPYANTQTTLVENQFPNPCPRDLWANYQDQSDEFMMYKFKANPCKKNIIHDHLSLCAHRGASCPAGPNEVHLPQGNM